MRNCSKCCKHDTRQEDRHVIVYPSELEEQWYIVRRYLSLHQPASVSPRRLHSGRTKRPIDDMKVASCNINMSGRVRNCVGYSLFFVVTNG